VLYQAVHVAIQLPAPAEPQVFFLSDKALLKCSKEIFLNAMKSRKCRQKVLLDIRILTLKNSAKYFLLQNKLVLLKVKPSLEKQYDRDRCYPIQTPEKK
jgi:hypothetical protein